MHQVESRVELAGVAGELLSSVFPLRKPIRRLGVSMSNFEAVGDAALSQMMFAF